MEFADGLLFQNVVEVKRSNEQTKARPGTSNE
jgi:hypothetical protein